MLQSLKVALKQKAMVRFLLVLFALLSFGGATPALADVQLSFHSFNGSVLFGRYPHTFIVLEGELEETGEVINENYGFTAKSVSTRILNGPVEHDIMIEKSKYIRKTNRHFTVSISDDQYREVIALMQSWRDAPGKFYDLNARNCIHFVGEIAKIAGITIEYPESMLRRPKRWLNHITKLNPQLGAEQID